MTDLTAAHLALAESSWEDLCKLKYAGCVTKDEFVAMQKEFAGKIVALGFGAPGSVAYSPPVLYIDVVTGERSYTPPDWAKTGNSSPAPVSAPVSTGHNFIGFDPGGESETAYISADLSDVVTRLSMVHERDARNVAVEGCFCNRCSDNRAASTLAVKAAGGKP